jgi:MGT family glycosyltransferase
MARVLFLNLPLYGHVLPTLDVAAELVNRGEEVTYYLTDAFAEAIQATGATFQCYESTLKDHRPAEKRFSQLLVEECRYVIPQVIERIRNARPDYILYESSCLWGRLLAQLFQVPIISCRTGLVANNHFSHISALLENSQGSSPGTFRMLIETYNDLAALADLCATYELPPPEQDAESLFFPTEDLNIVFTSRLLQPGGETFDERFVFVGTPLETRQARLPAFDMQLTAPQDAPVLYISLGTIYNVQPDFYRQCFQAFGNRPYRVILSLGRTDADPLSGPVPANFQICASVPQIHVLRQADIFVTHGGLNSAMEALYYGVPMIVVPQMPEQAMTARHLAELGLGIMLDKTTLTAETLYAAAQSLSNDTGLRARLSLAQTEVKAAGGARRAADAIQQFVTARQQTSI